MLEVSSVTNTQRIRIYPGKLKFVLVKFHRFQDKEIQTLFTFLAAENLSGLPCSHECKYGEYSDLFSYQYLHGDINGRSLSGLFNIYPLFSGYQFLSRLIPISVLRLSESNGEIFKRFCNLSE